MLTRKNHLSSFLTLCLTILFVSALFCRTAYAEPTPNQLEDINITGAGQSILVGYRYVLQDTPVSYGSTDENVAIVDPNFVTMYEAAIIPRGVGDCTIWFCDAGSRDLAVTIVEAKVHVTKEGLIEYVKAVTKPEENSGIYGSKKLKLEGPPYASYNIKVGKHTYSGTFSEKGLAAIKLKTVYKLKTKITYNIISGGITVTWKDKIKSGTDIEVAQLLKGSKKIKVTLENPHKGDVLTIKYAGKSYKKKITKNYDGKKHGWTIKLKKKMKNNSKFTVTIKNKYKQTLKSRKIRLKNGRFWKYADEDTDE